MGSLAIAQEETYEINELVEATTSATTDIVNIQKLNGATWEDYKMTLANVIANADAQIAAIAASTPAADKLWVWSSLTAGAFHDVTSFARSILDDADAATARTTLGLVIGTNVQAFDADLSTWAGLTPSANAQSIVTAADYSAMRTLLSLVPGTNVQAFDSDLSTYAGITPSANVQSLLAAADYSAIRTQLSLVPGTNVQAFDSDLSTYAGITPSANVQSLLGAADYSAIRTQLGLVIGTNVQAFDSDLTTYAGITPSANVQSLLGAANYSAIRTQLTLVPGTDVQAFDADLSVIAALADPNADRILFWDDSAGAYVFLTVGSGLSITGTSLSATGGGSGDVTAAANFGTDNRLIRSDGTTKGVQATGITVDDSDNVTGVTSLDTTNFTIGGVAVTSSAAELNILDGATLSTAELNHLDGVTSAIQTQLDAKAPNAGTQTGTHASPTVTNPLAPTWTTPMHTVWSGATHEIDLPAAAGYTGRGILIYNTGAFTITVDPNASEVIVRDGTVQTGGVTFTLSSGAGNFVALISDGARWITLGFKGTLTVGS